MLHNVEARNYGLTRLWQLPQEIEGITCMNWQAKFPACSEHGVVNIDS